MDKRHAREDFYGIITEIRTAISLMCPVFLVSPESFIVNDGQARKMHRLLLPIAKCRQKTADCQVQYSG